jgi:hypothetical protein
MILFINERLSMKLTKKYLEGKYYQNNKPNGLGLDLLIESAQPYGDSFILTLVSEGKKVKAQVKDDDVKKGDVKLRDLDEIENKTLKWAMPKGLLNKEISEIAKYMMENMDIETAKKRLTFYQDRESEENKGKIANVKLEMEKMKSEAEKIGTSVDDILEFINDNKELPVSDIFKGIQALIDTSKKETPINQGNNDPQPEEDPTDNQ